CTVCPASYKRRYELYRHRLVHTGVRNHACHFMGCNKAAPNGFARKDHLRQHLKQVHGGQHTRPHRCTYRGCTRSYARKFELYRHQRRHTGIKPHHCQVPGCDRGPQNGFYRKDHLRQHMKQVHFV
ncbi:hypothetical protein BDZ45DRAFT_582914, partial [Acephala macrosclerotiorum]